MANQQVTPIFLHVRSRTSGRDSNPLDTSSTSNFSDSPQAVRLSSCTNDIATKACRKSLSGCGPPPRHWTNAEKQHWNHHPPCQYSHFIACHPRSRSCISKERPCCSHSKYDVSFAEAVSATNGNNFVSISHASTIAKSRLDNTLRGCASFCLYAVEDDVRAGPPRDNSTAGLQGSKATGAGDYANHSTKQLRSTSLSSQALPIDLPRSHPVE
eukprot:3813799-Amphidinium_carterae.1